jgi:tRNA(Ile)-lysidine synthase
MKIRHEMLLGGAKNLLAFSGGVDSTALYHLLKNKNIDFDIAIVNYNARVEAKDELEYAKFLAKRDNKEIYTLDVKLQDSNFEINARDIRYQFFHKTILDNGYRHLITAHQLNDKLEWFLMQLSKGAGIVELYGFLDIDNRDGYDIVRPMIDISKKTILKYLKSNSIKYFYDKTNSDLKHKRNYFRDKYSDSLIDEFESGIKRSFLYIKEDIDSIYKKQTSRLLEQKMLEIEDLSIIVSSGSENIDIRFIDKKVKQLGVLMSARQREEVLKTKNCVISGKIAICYSGDRIFIAPFIEYKLNKQQKELYRINKIPPKIRAYIAKYDIDIGRLKV